VKILSVNANNRRRQFEIETQKTTFTFPYAKLFTSPCRENPLRKVWVDEELGSEAFSWTLADGSEESLHLDHVLEFNRDPDFVAALLLYKLSLEAKKRVATCGMSNRDVIRRLGTSASQYYRLLDPLNTRKSIAQLLALLQLVGCEVDFVIRDVMVIESTRSFG